MNKWLINNLSAFFKTSCLLCLQPAPARQMLCQPCLHDLPYLIHPCPQCGLPLPAANNHLGKDRLQTPTCGQCLSKPPDFQHTYCLLHYRTPADKLLQRLKFNQQLAVARMLGELFAERISTHLDSQPDGFRPECIVPVPLHPARLRKRGFNQAIELARPIADRLAIPLETRHCIRVKHTEEQSGLAVTERAKNMRNAFQVMAPFPYNRVAIFDDVMTTGQTANTLAKQLKKAGVTEIAVWSIARAVLD